MQPCPWSNKQLERLGSHIRDRTEPDSSLPSYSDVMLWFNDLATHVQRRIERIDWSPLLGNRIPEITSRPKTIDTLRDKLIRQDKTPLHRIADIAGVRFEADMTLSEQDAVAVAIAGEFDQDLAVARKDLRSEPHSGYRAVHLRLKLTRLVEVQVRTHLQGEWANMYEAAGDLFGRDIRYDGLPADESSRDDVEALRRFSLETITNFEQSYDQLQRIELAYADAATRFQQPVPGTRRDRKFMEDFTENKRKVEELQDAQSQRAQAMKDTLARVRASFQREGQGA